MSKTLDNSSAVDYPEAVDRALAQCTQCCSLPPVKRDQRRDTVLAEIQHTQARRLEPLPAMAWPHGRAPRSTGPKAAT